MTFCAAPARAGHYSLAINGGQYTDRGGNTHDDAQNGTEGGADYLTPYGDTASASGAFTVTCTWVPSDTSNRQSDPPPQSVVVDETGYAYFEANDATLGGTCADGLGDPVVPGVNVVAYALSGSYDLDNDHYSVHAGGPSFTLTHTATVSGGGDNCGSMLYSVSVFPVSTCPTPTQNTNYDTSDSLGGVTVDTDGSLKALTGQQISVGLNLGGANAQESNFQWSAGGSIFGSWDPSLIPQVVPLYTNSASFNFNDATNNDKVTVNCMATVTFPDGTTKTVTAKSQSVTFMKPSVTAWGVNTGTDVQTGIPSGTAQADVYGGTAYVYANEVWGPITIAVPSLGGVTPGGQGAIAQVIQSIGYADARSTGNTYVGIIPNPNGNGGTVALPTPALDTAIPYPFGYTLDSQGHMTVPASSSTFNAPGTGYSGDQPRIAIFPNATDAWTSSTLSGTFNTWVMYQPSRGIWVPLQMLTWSCGDTAMPTAGGSIIDPVDRSTWGAPVKKFSGGTPSDTAIYPQWAASSAGFTLGVPAP